MEVIASLSSGRSVAGALERMLLPACRTIAVITSRTASRSTNFSVIPWPSGLPAAFFDQTAVVALLDRLPEMDMGARTANDQALMQLVSMCVLHERRLDGPAQETFFAFHSMALPPCGFSTVKWISFPSALTFPL